MLNNMIRAKLSDLESYYFDNKEKYEKESSDLKKFFIFNMFRNNIPFVIVRYLYFKLLLMLCSKIRIKNKLIAHTLFYLLCYIPLILFFTGILFKYVF